MSIESPWDERPDDTRSGSYSRTSLGGGRCGGCGAEATSLRRGRCAACYARWVRARPVGIGAVCASCGDRRLVHLRNFELHTTWVVLCHNCSARAERVEPLPRSVEGLLSRIARDRRHRPDRRTGPTYWFDEEDRRGADRRVSDRSVMDATDLIVELPPDESAAEPDEFAPITAVHQKL